MKKTLQIFVHITLFSFLTNTVGLAKDPPVPTPAPRPSVPVPTPRPTNFTGTTSSAPVPTPRPDPKASSFCPNESTQKGLEENLNKRKQNAKLELEKVNKYHKQFGISLVPQNEMLDEIYKSYLNVCKSKLKLQQKQMEINYSIKGLANEKNAFTALSKKIDGINGDIDSQISLVTKEQNKLAQTFKGKRINLKTIIDGKINQYCTMGSNEKCKDTPLLKQEFEQIWGKRTTIEKNREEAALTLYWIGTDKEKQILASQKDDNKKYMAQLDQSNLKMQSLNAKSQDPKAPADLVAVKTEEEKGKDPAANPATDPAADPAADPSSEAPKAAPSEGQNPNGGYDPSLVPQVDPSYAPPSPDSNPDPVVTTETTFTPEPPPAKEKTSLFGGFWKTALWAGGAALAAGGAVWYYMRNKLQNEKIDNLKNQIEATGGSGTSGTTTVTTGTGSGTTSGGSDTGTLAGCTLSQVGVPTSAAVDQEIPAVEVSIINPNGQISTNDNSTVISVACTSNCSFTGPTSITAKAGVAKFSGLKFTNAGLNYVLTFSGGGCSSISSPAITVTTSGPRE